MSDFSSSILKEALVQVKSELSRSTAAFVQEDAYFFI